MRMFAAALVLSASVAGVACQDRNSGEEKKAEQPAKVASTIYKVGIDGAT